LCGESFCFHDQRGAQQSRSRGSRRKARACAANAAAACKTGPRCRQTSGLVWIGTVRLFAANAENQSLHRQKISVQPRNRAASHFVGLCLHLHAGRIIRGIEVMQPMMAKLMTKEERRFGLVVAY